MIPPRILHPRYIQRIYSILYPMNSSAASNIPGPSLVPILPLISTHVWIIQQRIKRKTAQLTGKCSLVAYSFSAIDIRKYCKGFWAQHRSEDVVANTVEFGSMLEWRCGSKHPRVFKSGIMFFCHRCFIECMNDIFFKNLLKIINVQIQYSVYYYE